MLSLMKTKMNRHHPVAARPLMSLRN